MSDNKPSPESIQKVAEALFRNEVATAIERHMPQTGAQTEFQEAKLSIIYADRLISARAAPLLKFGIGPSSEEWAKVRRAAMALQDSLMALSLDGISEMTWNAPSWWQDTERPLAMEGMLVADVIKNTCQEMERRRARAPKPRKNRNWRAAAVAKVARGIWAEEEWRTHPEKYGNSMILNALYIFGLPDEEAKTAMQVRRDYERHLQEYANKSEKQDAPGPFGRFLEDVLQVLGIKGSAATALRSLKDAEKQLSGG